MRGRKILILGLIVLVVGVCGVLAESKFNADPTFMYKTEVIQRGDILSLISTTGTLYPVHSVKVSSQVSGLVKNVFVDFNSTVEEGQPIARLDSEVYDNQVNQARATLVKAQAEAGQKHKVYKLYQTLKTTPDRISQYELDNSKAEYASASAQVSRASAELKLAESNLESTIIRSPIDGIVMSKKLSIGEFVTPSRTEPLFVIAEDLTKMELVAHVSEADIGKVNVGRSVSFIVDAYPDKVFESEVSQIRNSPITNQNVVTYEIVVPVNNIDNTLRPGMTAYAEIIIDGKQDVLKVPNIALTFSPNTETKQSSSGSLNTKSAVRGTVWSITKEGHLKPVTIQLGIEDNNFTHVLKGELQQGDEVVTGIIKKKESLLGSFISPQMNY